MVRVEMNPEQISVEYIDSAIINSISAFINKSITPNTLQISRGFLDILAGDKNFRKFLIFESDAVYYYRNLLIMLVENDISLSVSYTVFESDIFKRETRGMICVIDRQQQQYIKYEQRDRPDTVYSTVEVCSRNKPVMGSGIFENGDDRSHLSIKNNKRRNNNGRGK